MQATESPVQIAPDDPAMTAAIEAARETLPLFWAAMETSSGAANFSLKVAVPTKDGPPEHIWMNAPRRLESGRFSGIVGNEPLAAAIRYGAPYEFSAADITDWLFIRDGLIEGGYTIRVLLDHMDADEAEALRVQLAPERDL